MSFCGSALNKHCNRLLFQVNFIDMAVILLTGGTGMIGKALAKALLKKGHEVIVLTRSIGSGSSEKGISFAVWNPEKQEIDTAAFGKADHIIHLAGAGVADKRWTVKRKQEIVQSRVQGGELIVKSLQTIPNKIKTVVSASAIGWYGADDPSMMKKFVETDPAAEDFLGQTCSQWEQSTGPAASLQKRLVLFRIGIVLSNTGGAYKEFIKPLKWRVAAILGNGKQIISWIHIDDVVRLFIAALENEKFSGVYNAVAPQPVSNKELVLAMARSRKKRFISVKVPSFVLKWMLGEMSTEILKSATVSCDKVVSEGYSFQFPDINSAVIALTSQVNSSGLISA